MRTIFQLPTANRNGTYAFMMTSKPGANLYFWDCGNKSVSANIAIPQNLNASLLLINNANASPAAGYNSSRVNVTLNSARSYCMVVDYWVNPNITANAAANLAVYWRANDTGAWIALPGTFVTPTAALNVYTWGTRGSIAYQYFTGTWGSVPNTIGTNGTQNGTCQNFDIWGSCFKSATQPTNINYAYAFWAMLTIPVTGTWTFYLGCDDGCKMSLWQANTSAPTYPTINNDGSHAYTELSAAMYLTNGTYWMTVNYYNSWNTFPGMNLTVMWSNGAAYPKQPIPTTALSSRPFFAFPQPVIFQVTPWQYYTPGNINITITGYNFANDDGTHDPPIIQLRDPSNATDDGTPCIVAPGWNDSYVVCLLPTGQGTPLLEMWHPLFGGLNPMQYLPRWPEDTFFWVWNGQQGNCLGIRNPVIWDSYTWPDNWFCTLGSKASIRHMYNYNLTSIPAGYKCTNWNNPAQNNVNCCSATNPITPRSTNPAQCCLGGWTNSYYCVPTNAPYNLQMSCNGPIPNKACVSIREGSDPYWANGTCFFCADIGTPYGGGLYQLYAYSPPIINSIVPNHGPTVGGINITVTGQSFGIWPGVGGGFLIGFRACTVIPGTWNHTYFVCTLPIGEGINDVTLTVSGLQNISTAAFTYDPPILTSITPSTYYTLGNIPIVINGTNFGTTQGTVVLGVLPCPVVTWTDTSITCTLPSAQGTGYTVSVTTNWQIQSQNTLNWNYLPPNITSYTPVNADTTGGVTLNLQGTSFGTSGTVQVGGVLCVSSFYSHTQILCSLPAGQGLNIPITLTVSGQPQAYIPLFNYNPPVITSLTPASAGSGLNVFLTLVGTSFGQSGNITVGGQPCTYTPAQYIPGRILCALPNGAGFQVPVQLVVANQVSTPMYYFSYYPTITSISAPDGVPTAGGVQITVVGTSYAGSLGLTTVTLNGQSTSLVSTDSSTVVFTLPAGQGVALPVVVYINGSASNLWSLTYDPPTINAGGVSPPTGASTGGYNVTITGTNFAANPLPGVTIGLSNCPVTFSNYTTIICTSPPGLGPTNGVIVTVAGVPSNSVNFGYNPPTILGVNPNHGGIDGGYLVTLTGTEFAASGIISVGTLTLSMTPINITTIIFTMPKGEGNPTILVKIASQSSNAMTFKYDSPTISYITPQNDSTAGGDMLVVYGTNFGSTSKVYIGGALCVQGPGKNSSYYPCSIPAGMGVNQTVQVYDLTVSNTTLFSYNAPAIQFLNLPYGPTGGSDASGSLLTISGFSFGTTGSVQVGNQPCSTQNGIYTHTQIQCSVPPGQGSVSLVTVLVAGQLSNSVPYNYNPPTITNIIPSHGPTTGNTIIDVYGTNFGLSASMTIGGQTCTPTAFVQSHTQFECVTNPGQGTNIPVYIQVGDQNNTVAYSWNYDPPVITSVSPLNGPTSGGINITVNGQNFGIGVQPYTLTFNGNSVPFSFIGSGQNQLVFTLPAGTGINKAITYTVAGQTATYNGTLFKYDNPVIYSVSGCYENVWPKAYSCQVSGGDVLYINGTNWGNNMSLVTVSTNGQNCPVTRLNDSFVTCTLGPSPTGGYDLPIQVTVDTQLSGAPLLINYDGPTITANTLALTSNPSVTGNITVASTLIPQSVTFQGRFWGTDMTNVSVTYGFPGQIPKPFVCTVTSLTSLVSPNSALRCNTQIGTGAGLVFQIKVGLITSPEGVDVLSYPPPMIVDDTIRLGLNDNNSTVVTGTDQKGDRVYFDALNIGNDSSLITIMYGQTTSLNSAKTCLNPTIVAGKTNVVTCTTQSGFGGDYHFQVYANGVPSNVGNDVYNYITAPIVVSVSGCTNVGNKTKDCPTAGGIPITINGLYFGEQNTSVSIGRNLCGQVTFLNANFSSFSCILPAGTGNDLPVSIAVGARLSQPVNLLSYITATVTKISASGTGGCTTSGINVINCPRSGNVNITFTGLNFGPPSPTPIIVIGSQACLAIYSDPVTPDTTLQCTIPAGALTNVQIAFRQGLGSGLAVVQSTISYQLCPAGSYLAINHIDCTNCSVGKYSQNEGAMGSSACFDCAAGTYANTTGTQVCTQCDSGTASVTPGLSNCSACAAGYYANAQGLAACIACDVGYYSNTTGATTCIACLPGTINTGVHSTGCSACPAGKYNPYSAAVACIDCPAGTSNNQSGQSQCTICNAGTVSELSSSSLNCIPCTAGTYISTAQQSKCLQCNPGFFANTSGLANCYACTPGLFAGSTGSLGCSVCDPGKYTIAGADSFCPLCAEGTFGNASGLSQCEACPPGQYADAPGSTACVVCDPGLYAPEAGLASCLRCIPGSIAPNNGSTSCDKCPAGSYQTQSAQTSCVPCPAGQAAAGSGQPICLDCDSGRWSNTTNTTVCPACDAGYYSVKNPDTTLTIRGALSCQKCGNGTYGAFSGMAACSLCAPGFYADQTGMTVCSACAPGKATSASSATQCDLCQQGFFSASNGTTECNRCLAGKFSNITGADTCTSCPAGSYQPQDGLNFCSQCPVGTYAAATGSAQCTACPSGTFINVTGSATCISCPAGSYSGSPQSANCTLCQAGYAAASQGQTSCDSCSTGFFAFGFGNTGCTACPAGTFTSVLSSTSCQNCSVGTFAANSGSQLCTNCSVGYYTNQPMSVQCYPCGAGTVNSLVGQSACTPCLAGFSMPLTGQDTCLPCDSGTFGATNGSEVCQKCPPGKYSQTKNGIGPTECVGCPIGSFNGFEGQAECKPCGIGQFSNTTSQTDCQPCGYGTATAQTGQTACNQCTPGKYADFPGQAQCFGCGQGRFTADYGTRVCAPCTPGLYQGSEGQLSCLECPVGYFANGNEAFECTVCQKGKYGNETGLPVCHDCASGSYQSGEGALDCLLCPNGTASNQPGAQKCTSCLPGLYAPNEGTTDCQACSPGYYNTDDAQLSCTACPVGKFQSQEGQADCADCAARQIAPYAGSSTCIACELNSEANAQKTICECAVGMAAKNGSCIVCPDGAVCNTKGLVWDSLQTEEGWWSRNNTYYRCLQPKNCPGGLGSPCAPNRIGPICSYCMPHYQEVIGGSCIPCANKGGSVGYFIMASFIIIGALCFQFYLLLLSGRPLIRVFKEQTKSEMAREKAFKEGRSLDDLDASKRGEESKQGDYSLIETHTRGLSSSMSDFGRPKSPSSAGFDPVKHQQYLKEKEERKLRLKYNVNRFGNVITIYGPPAPKAEFTFKLKIVLSFLQIVTELAVGVEIQWPKLFKNFISFFDPANLDFVQVSSVSCVRSVNYYDKLLTAIVVPPAVCGAIVLFYFIPKTILARGDPLEAKAVRKKFWKLFLFVLFLIYPYCASTVLRTFICKNILGVYYLMADFTVICYTPQWYYWTKIAGLMVIVYPFGIPAFFLFMLLRYRYPKDRLTEVGVRAQLGFLYDAYQRELWWFEMVDMLHKLLVTSVLAFVQPFEAQLPVGILIVFGYLTIILLSKPYLRKSDDRLHLVAQMEILLFLIAGDTFYHSPVQPTSGFDTLMSLVLIAMLILFLAYFLSQAFVGIKKLFQDYKVKEREKLRQQEDQFYGVEGNLVTDDDKPLKDFETPILLKILPPSVWQKWPLRKYKKWMPHKKDTGRVFLKGLEWVDRRNLQPAPLFPVEGADDDKINLEENPIHKLSDADKLSIREEARMRGPSFGLPIIDETGERRKSESEGAAWADAAPLVPPNLETDDEAGGGPSSPSSQSNH